MSVGVWLMEVAGGVCQGVISVSFDIEGASVESSSLLLRRKLGSVLSSALAAGRYSARCWLAALGVSVVLPIAGWLLRVS